MGSELPFQTKWNIGTGVLLALLTVTVITLAVLVGTRTNSETIVTTPESRYVVSNAQQSTVVPIALAQESGVARVTLQDDSPHVVVAFDRSYIEPPVLKSHAFSSLQHVGDRGLVLQDTAVTAKGATFRFAMPAFPSHVAQNVQITTGVAANCVSTHFAFGTLFVACTGDVQVPQSVNFSFSPQGVAKSTFVDSEVAFPGGEPNGLVTGTQIWSSSGLLYLLCATDANGFCGAFSLDEGRTFEFAQLGLQQVGAVAHFRVGQSSFNEHHTCLVYVGADGSCYAQVSENAGQQWSQPVLLANTGIDTLCPCSVLFVSPTKVLATCTTSSSELQVFYFDGLNWLGQGVVSDVRDVFFSKLLLHHGRPFLLVDTRSTGSTALKLFSTESKGAHWDRSSTIALLPYPIVGLDCVISNGTYWVVFGDESSLYVLQNPTGELGIAWTGPFAVGSVTNQRQKPFDVTTSAHAVVVCSTNASIVFQNVLPTAADFEWQVEGKVVLT